MVYMTEDLLKHAQPPPCEQAKSASLDGMALSQWESSRRLAPWQQLWCLDVTPIPTRLWRLWRLWKAVRKAILYSVPFCANLSSALNAPYVSESLVTSAFRSYWLSFLMKLLSCGLTPNDDNSLGVNYGWVASSYIYLNYLGGSK